MTEEGALEMEGPEAPERCDGAMEGGELGKPGKPRALCMSAVGCWSMYMDDES
jgi:hypothetical protein